MRTLTRRGLARLTSSGRGTGDDGAALVIVVLVLFSLLAFAAVAIDTAALVQERRTLQNSADAAALAVAQRCAEAGTCTLSNLEGTAQSYANRNADDGAAHVDAPLCGSTPEPSLPACTDPPTDVPAGAHYVRITARTGTSGAAGRMPFNFAGLVGGGGQGVSRSATVAWGGPASMATAPFAIARCEWERRTQNPTRFAAPPPYPPWPPAERAHTIFFNGSGFGDGDGDAEDCDRDFGGHRVAGGFTFLETVSSTECRVTTRVGAWTDSWEDVVWRRRPPPACDADDFRDLKDTVVAVPVYDDERGFFRWNREVRISGYAAFYVVSYWFSGQMGERSTQYDQYPCGGYEACIRGYFLSHQTVSQGTVGGPSLGIVAIQFVQ